MAIQEARPATFTVAVTDPAAATDFSYTVTENDVMLIGAQIKLVTDSTSANRYVTLTCEDSSAHVFSRVGNAGAMVASLTHYLTFGRFLNANNTSVEGQLWHVAIPSPGIPLSKNDKIKSASTNVANTDALSAIVLRFQRL